MLGRKKNTKMPECPTESLADIAFLLLIFFLVTTVFNEEKGLEMLLPEAKAEEVQISQKNMLHIMIQPDGRVVLKKGKNPDEPPIPVDGLAERMRQEISLNPKVIAAVKTSPDATYNMMVQVLDELQEAEATRISLQMLGE